jgi:hypothetical protein
MYSQVGGGDIHSGPVLSLVLYLFTKGVYDFIKFLPSRYLIHAPSTQYPYPYPCSVFELHYKIYIFV